MSISLLYPCPYPCSKLIYVSKIKPTITRYTHIYKAYAHKQGTHTQTGHTSIYTYTQIGNMHINRASTYLPTWAQIFIVPILPQVLFVFSFSSEYSHWSLVKMLAKILTLIPRMAHFKTHRFQLVIIVVQSPCVVMQAYELLNVKI